jgi:hypothetical protein
MFGSFDIVTSCIHVLFCFLQCVYVVLMEFVINAFTTASQILPQVLKVHK